MQCAEITEAGKALRITSRPRPSAPDEGVVLRSLCSGVCHSDLHLIDDQQDIGGGQVSRAHRQFLGGFRTFLEE